MQSVIGGRCSVVQNGETCRYACVHDQSVELQDCFIRRGQAFQTSEKEQLERDVRGREQSSRCIRTVDRFKVSVGFGTRKDRCAQMGLCLVDGAGVGALDSCVIVGVKREISVAGKE